MHERLVELGKIERVGDQSNRRRVEAEVFELLPFGRRHRKHAGGARRHRPAVQRVEPSFQQLPALDTRRGAVRGEHVRDHMFAEILRRDRARQVPARVQVRDIEVAGVLAHVVRESHRRERLVVIGEAVRQVGEDAQRDAGVG